MKTSDSEYWVLVEPKTNTWKQVTEEESKQYAAVQIRLRHAITASAIDDQLYKTEKKK